MIFTLDLCALSNGARVSDYGRRLERQAIARSGGFSITEAAALGKQSSNAPYGNASTPKRLGRRSCLFSRCDGAFCAARRTPENAAIPWRARLIRT
jgi:hypothetical protein